MTASLLFFTGSWGKFLGEGGTGRRGKHVILLLERKRYPVIRKIRGRGGGEQGSCGLGIEEDYSL